jgi:hypothetical protein
VEVLELSQARRTRETVLGEDFQQFSSSLVSPKSRFYSISPANLTAAPRSAPARCLLPIGLIPPVRGPGPAGHLLHLAAISVRSCFTLAPPSTPLLVMDVNFLPFGHFPFQPRNLGVTSTTPLHPFAIYAPPPFARIHSFSHLAFAVEVCA